MYVLQDYTILKVIVLATVYCIEQNKARIMTTILLHFIPEDGLRMSKGTLKEKETTDTSTDQERKVWTLETSYDFLIRIRVY